MHSTNALAVVIKFLSYHFHSVPIFSKCAVKFGALGMAKHMSLNATAVRHFPTTCSFNKLFECCFRKAVDVKVHRTPLGTKSLLSVAIKSPKQQ